jgi:V-type H+-transporting ATPase subunit E
MPLSDSEARERIAKMKEFIDGQADETIAELEAKAEEEFQLEKTRLVTDQRKKLTEYYKKKVTQAGLMKKVQTSNLLNQSRLKILQAREQHMREVLEEAKHRLSGIVKDQARYKDVLQGLFTQSLFQLLEKDVTIHCRPQDVNLVEQIIRPSCETYQKATQRTVNVRLDKQHFLSSDLAGGVEVIAQNGRLKVVNTLESRLEQMSQQMVPEIRELLFGANSNRRFRD